MSNREALLKKIELFAAQSSKQSSLWSLSQDSDAQTMSLFDFRQKVEELLSSRIGEAEAKKLINEFSYVIDPYFDIVDEEHVDEIADSAAKHILKSYEQESRRNKWQKFQDDFIGTNSEIENWRIGKSPTDEEGLTVLPKFPHMVANILSHHIGKHEANKLVTKHTHIIGQYLGYIGAEEDLHKQAERAAQHLLDIYKKESDKTAATIQNKGLKGNMVDTKAILKKAELFEKLALYGDRKSFLKALAQESIWVDPIKNLQDSTEVPAAKPQFKLLRDGDRINPEVQKALVRLFPDSAAWIKADGIMGPNTRGALNRFKAEYHDSRDLADPTLQADIIRKSYIPSEAR